MDNNSRLRQFWNLIAETLRPWHDNGLPEHLQFGEVESEGFVRGFMLRAAQLSVGQKYPDGIFEILGLEHIDRTMRAWRPKHLLLLEDLSMAFHPIWIRPPGPYRVPLIHIDRTVEILGRYFAYCGENRSKEEIRESINRYIAEQKK